MNSLPLSASLPEGKMRAVHLTQDHQIKRVLTPIPELQSDEVLIAPTRAGLCGTDLHILLHGFVGTRYPVIPLHEFCGYVIKTGKDVRTLRAGDFVVVDPNVVDGSSRWCKQGRPNLCPSLTPIGVSRPGAAADYVAVPQSNAFVIQESLGHGVVALVEPLACALNAIGQAQQVKDCSVLIFGGGTMGLLTAICARVAGASHITLLDVATHKLALARQVGVDDARLPHQLDDEKFDLVFEATGAAAALRQALTCLEKAGALVQIGVHDEQTTISLNPLSLFENEWRLIGSNSCADKFPAAVELMPDIADKVALLVGEIFPVWDFDKAVQHMQSGTSIKTQFSFTPHLEKPCE